MRVAPRGIYAARSWRRRWRRRGWRRLGWRLRFLVIVAVAQLAQIVGHAIVVAALRLAIAVVVRRVVRRVGRDGELGAHPRRERHGESEVVVVFTKLLAGDGLVGRGGDVLGVEHAVGGEYGALGLVLGNGVQRWMLPGVADHGEDQFGEGAVVARGRLEMRERVRGGLCAEVRRVVER